jgi:hypothetical protein
MTTQVQAITKPLNLPLFMFLGIVFWFTGVLFVRLGGEALFISGSPWLFFLFAIAVPASWGFVQLTTMIGQVKGLQLLNALVIETITATLMDGTVLTWFQTIYSQDSAKLLLIAAWLLWGGGMGLAVGYWQSNRQSQTTD